MIPIKKISKKFHWDQKMIPMKNIHKKYIFFSLGSFFDPNENLIKKKKKRKKKNLIFNKNILITKY